MSMKVLFREKRIAEAYRRLFETEDGKVVLDDLVHHRTKFYQHTAPDMDPVALKFWEGRRSIVLHILQMVGFGPERIIQHIKEGELNERAEREDYE